MLIFVFLISLCVELWYTLKPTLILWDSAMYIGIGKYIMSGGKIGVFEAFRPPLLPLLFGFVWKLGIDPFIFGKIFALISSMLTLWIVYEIGKRVSKNTGILAATLVSFTVIFLTYTNAPLSDIPSTLFTTLAVLLALRENYWLSGISIAIAFLIRFPQALILIPIILFILVLPVFTTKPDIRTTIIKIIKLVLGFLLPLVPYFISNMYFYHDPFFPIRLANQVASDPVNAHGRDIFFYIKSLLQENPFYAFSFTLIVPLWIQLKKMWTAYTKKSHALIFDEQSKVLFIVSLSLLIIGSYFNFNTHLELRYSVAFLPFLALASAYMVTWITHRITSLYENRVLKIVMVFVLCVLFFISHAAYVELWPQYASTPEIDAFYSFFKDTPGASVITTSPQILAYSDSTIVQAIDTWEVANALDASSYENAEYVAVNSCSLICESEATCNTAKTNFENKLRASGRKIVFNETGGSCQFLIYKK